MTSRERPPPTLDDESTTAQEDACGVPGTDRDMLAKYLGYVLPEVAAINPTSALLLDQAISRLLEAPGSEPMVPPKYS